MSFETQWDAFLDEFRNGLTVLAKNSLQDWKDTARADGEAYLEAMKDDLPRWTKALKEGLLTKDEFEQLLQGQKTLLKLHMLTAAGLTKTRLEQFRVALISLVTTSAYSAFGI
ncbi:hypothetical protein [Sedimentitalea nanhaiensis]|uniref:Uncharacterized protein n=1 Tax=Sedimentitalea nanhaiensis TaxID=999627 RepID=A0A1I7CUS9_9RHOB|nr:hypothetical protein [Sedimentitalea nanhaiensis]SFU03119.1 hypothetical protein SAMN05216236_1205 [Sedimentitalea nanhaiensis]